MCAVCGQIIEKLYFLWFQMMCCVCLVKLCFVLLSLFLSHFFPPRALTHSTHISFIHSPARHIAFNSFRAQLYIYQHNFSCTLQARVEYVYATSGPRVFSFLYLGFGFSLGLFYFFFLCFIYAHRNHKEMCFVYFSFSFRKCDCDARKIVHTEGKM